MKNVSTDSRELLVIRSLTDSDLGIFAAHRKFAKSKQRAVNINAPIAEVMLAPKNFAAGTISLDCIYRFAHIQNRENRHFGKIHKNWRLGGKKLEHPDFAELDSKDFMLLRTVAGNDGSHPVFVTFISKKIHRIVHAGIVATLDDHLKNSMAYFHEGDTGFVDIAKHCPKPLRKTWKPKPKSIPTPDLSFPPMPSPAPSTPSERKPLPMHKKLRQPHFIGKLLQVTGDLSAPAQKEFLQIIEDMAAILREILVNTGQIVKIKKDHNGFWKKVSGKPIGFVDGGLANLSMLGSVPIAARVGGYTVIPGRRDHARETFEVLKCLIDELYSANSGGVFDHTFPDTGALRDAARVSIEAAGVVKLLSQLPMSNWIMLHGSLVNPVSRYTDIIRDGVIKSQFPDFSENAILLLLQDKNHARGPRKNNFINVYLQQLKTMLSSSTIVCGVVEREGTTTTTCRSLIADLDENAIAPFLPLPPAEWKSWFLKYIDPSDDDELEGQRITDSLLFRCILEPGEAILPIPIERNLLRKAPNAWKEIISDYPRPMISYLQATEWNAPIRIEMFEKDLPKFRDTAELVMHSALLLPKYAFPVGLDIVDKYAKIPNWMSRPINARMAAMTLKRALDSGDEKLFNSCRYLLCGSGREWMLRPGING